MAVLKNLMSTCQYSQQEYNNQLRDRLLHVCKDSDMQLGMIKVGDMTFATTLESALKHEMCVRVRMKCMSRSHCRCPRILRLVFNSCHSKACHASVGRCGGRNREAYICKFKNEKCHFCLLEGHIRRRCPKMKEKKSEKSDKELSGRPFYKKGKKHCSKCRSHK